MKKIMIVAAATAAAIALADTTLTSSNVVGYQDIATPQGSSMRCSTFRTVLAASYPLSEIRVTGADGSGDVVAQTISSEGLWEGQYYYLTEANTGYPDGWFKDPFGDEAADDVDLAPGDALFVTSEYNDLTFTFPAVLN